MSRLAAVVHESVAPAPTAAAYHGQTIWVGDNLDDSMKYLRLALDKGGGKKQQRE